MKDSLKTGLKCAAVITAGLFVTNKIAHSLATVKQLLTNNNGSFYSWTHGKIYFKKEGSGPAMLLIHDLNPASNSYEWNHLVSELSKDYTVYTMDLLGCGRSDRPNITYTGFLYVRLIEQFIQDIIGGETIVVATGRSSSFTLLAAKANTDLISEIILINPQSFRSQNTIPNGISNLTKQMITLPIFGTAYYNFKHSYYEISRRVKEDFLYDGSSHASALIDHYYESAHLKFSAGKYLYASIQTGYTNNNVVHAVRSLEQPIHIIVGEDAPNSGVILENYKKLNASIDSCILPYTKHLPHVEAADRVLKSFHRFLD